MRRKACSTLAAEKHKIKKQPFGRVHIEAADTSPADGWEVLFRAWRSASAFDRATGDAHGGEAGDGVAGGGMGEDGPSTQPRFGPGKSSTITMPLFIINNRIKHCAQACEHEDHTLIDTELTEANMPHIPSARVPLLQSA